MEDKLPGEPPEVPDAPVLKGSVCETASVPAESDERSPFGDWKQQLHALRQHARAAMERLSEYLRRRRPAVSEPSFAADIDHHLTETLESISMRQDSLETLLHETYRPLDSTPSLPQCDTTSGEPPEWAVQLQAVVTDRLAGFGAQLQSLSESLDRQTVAVTESQPELESSADSAETFLAAEPFAVLDNDDHNWLRALLGPGLHDNPQIGKPMRWLEENVLADNGDALLLVGQLLVFRFAGSDRKPTLLKDVGEAFYRCFPKTLDRRDPFEDELVDWLRQHCEEAGLPNSIELVHPGERFDATRHSPLERGGVEVAEVLGWVVLRDGGRVFSKASVQTR